MRVAMPEDRVKWVRCLKDSIARYQQHQQLVETFKDQGLLPQQMVRCHGCWAMGTMACLVLLLCCGAWGKSIAMSSSSVHVSGRASR